MKYLVAFCFSVFALGSFAQENDSSFTRHEIGVNLYSFSNAIVTGSDTMLDNKGFPQHAIFNALMYKFHFKKSALRISFMYAKKEFEPYTNGGFEEGEYRNGSVLSKEARIGYERTFGTEKIKPYVAMELVYSHSYNDGFLISSCMLHPTCCPAPPMKLSTTVMGVIPSLGVSYQISNLFSVRFETSATYGAMQQVNEPWHNDMKYYDEVESIFIFNPVSVLSVNVNF